MLGKPDEALAFFQQALEVCAKIRYRPEIALTRLGLAELLLDVAGGKRDNHRGTETQRRGDQGKGGTGELDGTRRGDGAASSSLASPSTFSTTKPGADDSPSLPPSSSPADDPELTARIREAAEALKRPPAELRKEAMGHLDFAIAEFQDMKMQPSLERALKRKEILGA